ncbi:hypothetical protein D3C85_1881830 [compost metagenome]
MSATAASTALDSGSTMRNKMYMSLAPSILADSSSSVGMLLKNLIMIIMKYTLTAFGTISAHSVSIIFSWLMTI